MKQLAAWWLYLRHGIWVGVGLISAGLVAGFLAGWPPIAIGLLLVGMILIGGWVLLGAQVNPEQWDQRSAQTNLNALVATVSVLVILGCINLLSARYGARFDWSENQIFTLSPESQAVLQQLDEQDASATVWIFDVVPNASDRQLLNSYQDYSDDFTYTYVDPNLETLQAQRFGVRSLGEVYLELGDDRQQVQRIDQIERLSEQRLTNRLSQMVSGDRLTAYFLVGHGEFNIDDPQGGYGLARAALEQRDYQVQTLDLAVTPTVPEDADVIVVAGPQQALFEPEIAAINDFLRQGKGLLLLIDPNTDPGLDEWLDTWGVEVLDQVALDNSGRGQALGLGPGAPVITDYGDHPITQAFGDRRSFYPLARPLALDPPESVTATPILRTGIDTQAGFIDDEGISVDPAQPANEPLILGAALRRPAESLPAIAAEDETESTESAETAETDNETTAETEATSPSPADPDREPTPDADRSDPPSAAEPEASAPEARLVVIGNSTFANDGVFDLQINGDVFINAIAWLGQNSDATLSIRPKEVTNRRIFMSLGQQILLGLYSWLMLPVAGIALALFTWWRRR